MIGERGCLLFVLSNKYFEKDYVNINHRFTDDMFHYSIFRTIVLLEVTS